MQGSRKCAVPRGGKPDSGKAPTGRRKRWGRIPLGPPSPADGMGGGTSLRVALPELAISPRRLGGDGRRSADDQRTILGPVHAHFRGTFRTRSRCCARAARGSEGCCGRSGKPIIRTKSGLDGRWEER